MNKLLRNSFSSFELTPEEFLEGSKLLTLQKEVIQNYSAMATEEKNFLKPDPNDYASFLQKEAYLRGQMDAYTHLLQASEDALELVDKPIDM